MTDETLSLEAKVSVLWQKDGCTLLKKGYDDKTGQLIFDPLPHSRTNIIKGELTERKGRLQQEKDILQAITPWIVAAICMFGLIAITYVSISGFIEISENIEEGNKELADAMVMVERARGGTVQEPHDLGPQEPKPPVIS